MSLLRGGTPANATVVDVTLRKNILVVFLYGNVATPPGRGSFQELPRCSLLSSSCCLFVFILHTPPTPSLFSLTTLMGWIMPFWPGVGAVLLDQRIGDTSFT